MLFLLFGLFFLVVMPCLIFGAACVPYTNMVYTLQAKGATGTLTKTQTCQADRYSITSTIKAKKGLFSKEVTQTAMGAYTTSSRIVSQTFKSTESDASLPPGNIDPLSLALYLSLSLDSGVKTFSTLPLFYNNKTLNVQCSLSNLNAAVTLLSGEVVPAVDVTCIASGNTLKLEYSFRQDHPTSILTMASFEGGEETLRAVIQT